MENREQKAVDRLRGVWYTGLAGMGFAGLGVYLTEWLPLSDAVATQHRYPMKIVALNSAHRGYTGIYDDGHAYVYFKLARGVLKRLQVYPKTDFTDRAHFIQVMQRFMSPSCFLSPPRVIDTLSTASLQRILQPATSPPKKNTRGRF